MCSQSVSGSSLLSGYNEDDARERSGRSRREFEAIDAVLYDEEKNKRLSIKRICEEWSSKPHFRIRGRTCEMDQQPATNAIHAHKSYETTGLGTSTSSSAGLAAHFYKASSSNTNEVSDAHPTSGRSSVDSIEGSELTNNSDMDDDDATHTAVSEHFSDGSADSFDTDDDDENDEFSSGVSTRDRARHRHHHHHSHSKQPPLSIKCMKDSIVHSLASILLQQFLTQQQPLLHRYAKFTSERNTVKLRPKLRPYSLPPRSLSQNRFSLPVASSVTSTGALSQISSYPFRSTPEPDMKLTGLLRVTPLRVANSRASTTASASPRRSHAPAPLPPPVPIERLSTPSSADKRNPQQITLIGTAMSNVPAPLPPSTSQNASRQPSSTWRYRSATTTNANLQSSEVNTRLPPINIERLISNDPSPMNRSNTITSAIAESAPSGTRAVSGTSTGSNLSSTVRPRTLASIGRVHRTSRPISISAMNTSKEQHNSLSNSPTRSLTGTIAPANPPRPAGLSRTQQKRPLLTTKAPSPVPSSAIIKVSAAHIY